MAPLLPTLAAHARSILSSAITTHEHAVRTASAHWSQVGPLAARAILLARDDGNNNKDDNNNKDPQTLDPAAGVTNPNDINNTFIFVLFGLIGVAFVVTGIWFFFWAKNGGFHFKENDWEDYKSTVLRRRGPNGTLLSGATESTNLGGGSVYKDVDDGSTEYTGGLTQMTGVTHDTSDTVSTLTGITAGASDIAGRERRRRAREKKEREREKKKDRKNRERSRRKVGEDGVLVDEEAEADAKRNLRAYRHERPARVGGLNKEFEGSEWDGSTNPEMSTTGSELLLSNRQSTPTSTPTKEKEKERDHAEKGQESSSSQQKKKSGGGIRKVYSTADRTANRENERLRTEARRLAEKGRVAGSSRRDFSFQRADLRGAGSTVVEEEETGSMISASERGRFLPPPVIPESDIGDGSDIGTKSYRHFIPGISNSSGVGSASGSGSVVGSSVAESSVVGSSVGTDYAEERRRKRGAQRYRRAEK
ncbi:hypothetical protein HD806DRAFT_320740 [Xylariaceae sp. AK1471]|nr:hypothetical protein HD806DRAFT_320740 [Xylariaceae sp. AK1471]